jgi:Peptidase M10 serralysin C terminal
MAVLGSVRLCSDGRAWSLTQRLTTHFGGSGADCLDGGTGIDTLTGNRGADDCAFDDGDSRVGNRDEITDFVEGQDDLDLSNSGKLDFIGQNAFSATDQVSFTHSGGNTIVSINNDSGLGIDTQIELAGIFDLSAADFIFWVFGLCSASADRPISIPPATSCCKSIGLAHTLTSWHEGRTAWTRHGRSRAG